MNTDRLYSGIVMGRVAGRGVACMTIDRLDNGTALVWEDCSHLRVWERNDWLGQGLLSILM